MEGEQPTSSSFNWSAVSQLYPNLRLIWRFLMRWSTFNTQFSATELINLYRVCGDIAWILRDDQMKAAVFYSLGETYAKILEYHDALECFFRLLELSERARDAFFQGNACNSIGAVYKSLGKYKDALDYLRRSLIICQRVNDLPGLSNALCNIGIVHKLRADYDKALECHEKDLQICKHLRDLAGEEKALCNIGIVHESRAEFEKAMNCYRQSLQICKQRGDMVAEGRVLCNIGSVHLRRAEYKEAMECYQMSLEMFQETGDLAEQGRVLCNIGTLQEAQKKYDDALLSHKEALKLCQQTGDLAGEATVLCNIGNVHHSLEEFDEAMIYDTQGQEIWRKLGNLAGQGGALGNIGNIHLSRKEKDKAIKCFQGALKIYQETGQLMEEASASSNLGVLLSTTSKLLDAQDQLGKSISCYEKIFFMLNKHCQSRVSIVDTYIGTYQVLTCVLVELGKTEEAVLTMDKGRAQALRDKLLDKYKMAPDNGNETKYYKDLNSLIITNNATFVTYCLSPRERLLIFPYTRTLGKLTTQQFPRDELVRITKGRPDTEMKSVFDICVKKIILHANEHLQQNWDNTFEDRSLRQVELKVRRKEQIKRKSTAPVVRDEPEERGDIEESERKELGSSVDEMLLEENKEPEYGSANDDNSSFSGADIAVGGHAELSETTVVQCCLLHKSGDDLLKDLYRALIAPIESDLEQSDLAIVPDGPLFFVPFAALQAPDGKFLSETKRIRVGSSFAMLKILEDYPVQQQSTGGALIVGGPCVRNVMFQGEFQEKPFEDLRFAWKEALEVGKLLHERPFIAFRATKGTVMNRLQTGVAVIHIATHGSADTGELLLAPETGDDLPIPTEEDYLLTVKEICSCNINAQLVVLSSCHAGRGEIKAEGVVGLARAFLEAGARSVLATLWQVSDEGTLYFMKSFYRHFTGGKSACTSLQEAMREMRESPRWSHWSNWGSFFILGHDVTPFSGCDDSA